MQKYTTPKTVPWFNIPCIQGHPNKKFCSDLTAAAFTQTDAGGETYLTVNFKSDGSRNGQEFDEALGSLMKKGFESVGWMVISNRAGKRGESGMSKITGSMDNVDVSGGSFKCTSDITKIQHDVDTVGGIENGCKKYACLVDKRILDICTMKEEILWKPNSSDVFDYDAEKKINEYGFHRSATKDGKNNSFKLDDKYKMHTGWFACALGKNCEKVLMGSSSGWFNFEITSASSLVSGAAIAVGAFALF